MAAVSRRAAESLKTAVEQTRFGLSGFNPEAASTGWALQVIAAFHFLEACEEVFGFGAVEQAVELGDSCRSPDKQLNAAGVARNVGLFLLCDPHLAWAGADRARKHLLPAEFKHLCRPPF